MALAKRAPSESAARMEQLSVYCRRSSRISRNDIRLSLALLLPNQFPNKSLGYNPVIWMPGLYPCR